MKNPIRHDNHVLETESNKYFNSQVPNAWVVDTPTHDYGIDFVVNIVSKKEVTGFNFSVQLKSKIKESKMGSVAFVFKHSTLRLFNTKLEPVLIVGYVKEEKEAYWVWYNELDLDLTSSQQTFTINIPKTNRLSQIDWNNISKYVQKIFSFKTLVDGIKSLELDEISNSETLAWKYYFSNDYEKAIFYFKNLLKETPKETPIIEALAQCQYQTFSYKKALMNINKAIEISGTLNQHLIKACILAEDGITNELKGKIIEAKNLFKEFLKVDNNQFIHHYNYANTLSRLDYHQDAINHFEICLKLNPNYEKAWKNLGQVYFNLKKHKEEIRCYDNALRINPKLAQALFSKGVTLSRIYSKDKEALQLFMSALECNKNMLQEYKYGYFEIALVHRNLGDIIESLTWINKGLGYNLDDVIYLNFKSNLLIEHWEESEALKIEALKFFEFRLELENDFKSLYAILLIRQLNDESLIFDLIKKHTTIFEVISFETIRSCEVSLKSNIIFLFHLDEYIEFRSQYPIYRYYEHLVSDLFMVSGEFWELLNFIFVCVFSGVISEYIKQKDFSLVVNIAMKDILLSTNAIRILFPNSEMSQEKRIDIMSHLYSEYAIVINREIGLQTGYLKEILGVESFDCADSIESEWDFELNERILIEANIKLKLLKED